MSEPAGAATDAQYRKVFSLLSKLGISDRDERRAVIREAIDDDTSSTRGMSVAEASRLIRALEDRLYADNPARMFEAAQVMKSRRKHDLLAALSRETDDR